MLVFTKGTYPPSRSTIALASISKVTEISMAPKEVASSLRNEKTHGVREVLTAHKVSKLGTNLEIDRSKLPWLRSTFQGLMEV